MLTLKMIVSRPKGATKAVILSDVFTVAGGCEELKS